MLHNKFLAASLLFFVLSGCKTTTAGDGRASQVANADQDEEASDGTISCAYSPGGNGTTVRLKKVGDTLAVSQHTGFADSVIGEYSIAPIALQVAPVQTPVYNCQQGQNSIILWKKYASINRKYYSVAQLQNSVAPTGPCTADGTRNGPRFPSACGCPAGYNYGGSSSGQCLKVEDGADQ